MNNRKEPVTQLKEVKDTLKDCMDSHVGRPDK
jgi:hypothetical protein